LNREREWKIAISATVNLSVMAPGAQKVRLLYRPIVARGRYVTLKTLTEPTDHARGKFSTEWKATPDGQIRPLPDYSIEKKPGGRKDVPPPADGKKYP
jgi:hypothetical protein